MVSDMAGQFYCKNPKRRKLVRDHSALNGIDFLEVSLDQNTLLLHFVHDLQSQLKGLPAEGSPLTEKNVQIVGGERIWDVRAVSLSADKNVLKINVNKPGDFSVYRLRLVKSPHDKACPDGFDPQLSEIDFSFKMSCPGEISSILPEDLPSEIQSEPQIDYQAKDYASFRRLMLDRLSVVMPQWKERHPSDVMIAIVELLAYAGDYLSYYQDAVASEAYLETARKRYSVRRHARMLDYRVDEGCNSRLWVCFEVEADEDEPGRDEIEPIRLARGDRLLTRCNTSETVIEPDSTERWKKLAFASGSIVFELLHDAAVRPAHNKILFYSWSEEVFTLQKGATSATLLDGIEKGRVLHLHAGDVLIFEEVKSIEEGGDPDPAHRHAVRLTRVRSGTDPLNGQPVLHIDWHRDDALPWPLPVHLRIDGLVCRDIFCVRGNVALADQGRTVENRRLLPPEAPEHSSFRPRLAHKNITFSSIYDHRLAQNQSVYSCIVQKSYEAVPAVKLEGDGSTWTARGDLLGSGRSSPHFVLEIEEDGTAFLRFGDGIFGRRPSPGAVLYATYRVGNATAGNVGPDSIFHFVPEKSINLPQPKGLRISKVRNPMPAQGGIDREPTDQVRLYAPYVFRRNERGVTEEDYVEAALRYPEVSGAVATLRWTGSWHTMFVTIDRKGGAAIDNKFKKDIRAFLEQFRLAGHDMEIEQPVFVPLHIAFTVHVKPNYLPGDVRIGLFKVFSRGLLSDGRRGFFHPDNFTFGQSVFLSQIVDVASEVAGVSWIDASDTKRHHFHRWGKPSQGEIRNGVILMRRLEIARLDNDPNASENGRIEFIMEGGL
jgi:hypothetical protein